jgi:hypothetical protein
MGIIGIEVYQLAVNAKETDSLGNLMKSPSIIFIPVYQDNFLSQSIALLLKNVTPLK